MVSFGLPFVSEARPTIQSSTTCEHSSHVRWPYTRNGGGDRIFRLMKIHERMHCVCYFAGGAAAAFFIGANFWQAAATGHTRYVGNKLLKTSRRALRFSLRHGDWQLQLDRDRGTKTAGPSRDSWPPNGQYAYARTKRAKRAP